jgi:hypothetical protein
VPAFSVLDIPALLLGLTGEQRTHAVVAQALAIVFGERQRPGDWVGCQTHTTIVGIVQSRGQATTAQVWAVLSENSGGRCTFDQASMVSYLIDALRMSHHRRRDVVRRQLVEGAQMGQSVLSDEALGPHGRELVETILGAHPLRCSDDPCPVVGR